MNSFSYTLDVLQDNRIPIEKEYSRINSQLDALYNKFCNEGFMNNAPQEIIDKEVKKYEDFSFKQQALLELLILAGKLKFNEDLKYRKLSVLITDRAQYTVPIK